MQAFQIICCFCGDNIMRGTAICEDEPHIAGLCQECQTDWELQRYPTREYLKRERKFKEITKQL